MRAYHQGAKAGRTYDNKAGAPYRYGVAARAEQRTDPLAHVRSTRSAKAHAWGCRMRTLGSVAREAVAANRFASTQRATHDSWSACKKIHFRPAIRKVRVYIWDT